MIHLKRLQELEACLAEIGQAKRLEKEYLAWLQKYPIEKLDERFL